MTAADVAKILLGAALGGLVAFAWSQIAFGNRLTRLEADFHHFREAVKTLAGRRQWPGNASAP